MNLIFILHAFNYLYRLFRSFVYNYLWSSLDVLKDFYLVFSVHFLNLNFSPIIVDFFIDSFIKWLDLFVIGVISLFRSFL